MAKNKRRVAKTARRKRRAPPRTKKRAATKKPRPRGRRRATTSTRRSTTKVEGRLRQLTAQLTARTKELESANRELFAQESTIRAMLDAAVDGVITTDAQGIIQGVNRAAREMFDYAGDELIGRHLDALLPNPLGDVPGKTGVKRFLQSRYPLEVVGRRQDGSTFPVEVSIREIDRLPRYTAYLHDLSRRKALEREVIDTSTLEQQRIGQEIHDGLGQRLTGVALMAQGIADQMRQRDSTETEAAEQLVKQLQQALDEAHRLAKGLSPVEIVPEGLSRALRALAADIQATSGAECRFEDEPDLTFPDHAVATHLFRIVQEAVQNAVKHARARRIDVRLHHDQGQLVLSVSDDGDGFDPDVQPRAGLGLHIMQYRASIIGGILTVHSKPDQGTVIRCVLPSVVRQEGHVSES